MDTQKNFPFFTIITATYNAQNTLPHLLQSLANQSCQDFVWLCQDGASTDNTMKIVHAWQDKIHISAHSEKDNGIYDAWNKALLRYEDTLGQWILFLGADDVLASSDVLEKVKQSCSTLSKSKIYAIGELQLFNHENILFPVLKTNIPYAFENRRTRMTIPHSALLTQKSVLCKHLFDSRYRILGDWEWLLRTWKQENQAVKLDVIITHMALGGISSSPRWWKTYAREKLYIKWKYEPKKWTQWPNFLLKLIKLYYAMGKSSAKDVFYQKKATQKIWDFFKNLKNTFK